MRYAYQRLRQCGIPAVRLLRTLLLTVLTLCSATCTLGSPIARSQLDRDGDHERTDTVQYRIVNGLPVVVDTAPWFAQVIVITRDERTGTTLAGKCGGSLIQPDVVMTAAHCFQSANMRGFLKINPQANYSKPVPGNVLVTLGRVINLEPVKPVPGADHHVVAFTCHPSFQMDQTYTNDVCLLKLDRPSTNKAVTLNIGRDARSNEAPGTQTYAYGFGNTSPVPIKSNRVQQSLPSPRLLRSREMSIVDPLKCARAINKLLAPSGGGIPAAAFGAHLLCTDSSVSDACHGDSGGPLLRANTTVQVGIVSYGYGCRTGIPALNTRVSHFGKWIAQTLAQLGSNARL